MKFAKYISLLAFSFLLLALSEASAIDYKKTKVLRWADPFHTPLTYQEYIAQRPILPFEYSVVAQSARNTDDPAPIAIVVNSSLYPQIQTAVTQYCLDLEQSGYEWSLITTQGGTAENLKARLSLLWQAGTAGALLIGDLPVPWFELYEDWNADNIPDDPFMVNFPCDLFYMDLDGIWADEDLDGIYDVHQGAWQPDFYIGRLNAGPLPGDEAPLINSYFAKNHLFRTTGTSLPDRALAYIDDDWSGGAPQWASCLEQVWANTVLVNEINQTTANDYRSRWDDDYQSLLVAVHSAPTLHTFCENNGSVWSYVWWSEIFSSNPRFQYLNLFACSNANYIENNNCGASYLFGEDYSLNVIGSTKTGSMLYFEDYYPPMSQGMNLGEAFIHWFGMHGDEPGYTMWSRSWFYGMTNLGDPTLAGRYGLWLTDCAIDDDSLNATSGDGDGIADIGEVIDLSLFLTNNSNSDLSNLTITLSTNDPFINLIDPIGMLNSLANGDTIGVGGFRLGISPLSPDCHQADIPVEISDALGHIWYENLELEIRAPKIELVSYDWREIAGDMDGLLDEGETIGLTFGVKNNGGQETFGLNPAISSPQWCIIDTSLEEQYYLPLNFLVNTSELVTQFLFFPEGNAGVASFVFTNTLMDSQLFYLPGGDNLNIMNRGEDWSVVRNYALSPDFNNIWTLDQNNYYSPNSSYRFGEGEEYLPQSDGALELPLILLQPQSNLSFQHIYDIEAGYDGGIVEISQGEGWERLFPSGGYPGNSVNNGSFPGGACYNGEQLNWTSAEFNLVNFQGCAKIRFRFGADGGIEGYGWNLDDINLTSEIQAVLGQNENPPQAFALLGNYPNPFNSELCIELVIPLRDRVKITIYNIKGEKITEIFHGILASGVQNVTWSAENLASGIYLYSVEYHSSINFGKCLLLK
jgi:hypothetical protein